MTLQRLTLLGLLSFLGIAHSFVPESRTVTKSLTMLKESQSSTAKTDELSLQKQKLFSLIGKTASIDPVLADPKTKEAVQISIPGVLFGGENRNSQKSVRYNIRSPTDTYSGSTDSFIDLLEPIADPNETTTSTSSSDDNVIGSNPIIKNALRQAIPFIPPPLRAPLSSITSTVGIDEEYIPMRDLFTSPAVSFAYERGWRQNFRTAGFPGPDIEAEMAMEYFAPVVARSNPNSVVVDMSCATGLFTRRFASSKKYGRVLGCDYSESMLTEARRRIRADPNLSPSSLEPTRLDLVRLDVGQIPMQTESVDCLHAGAAMHCWPDLDAAASEIYRVLKPGGRYFATTFLSTWFRTLMAADGGASEPSKQAFQYFQSVDTLRSLMERGGFEPNKISIEVLSPACVVIRCEK